MVYNKVMHHFLNLTFIISLALLSSQAFALKVCDLLTSAVEFNRNAKVAIQAYHQPNKRSFEEYQSILSMPEGFIRDGMTVLDSGSGLGVAMQEAARKHNIKAIAVNAQDVSGADVFKQGADLVASGKLVYRDGYSEAVLAEYPNQIDRITDVWGAYPYTGNRAYLVEQYYHALKPGGEARILVPSFCQTVLKVTKEESRNYTWVDDEQHQKLIMFEQWLHRAHPEIFDWERSKHPRSSMSLVLVIKKPMNGSTIDLGLTMDAIRPSTDDVRQEMVVPKIYYLPPQ